METNVIRHLMDAVDAIVLADKATKWGLVSDQCQNAITELRTALRMAADGEAYPVVDDEGDDE